MKNYVQPGDVITVTAPAGGMTSGVGVLIGDHLFGVATGDVAAGQSGEVQTTGVVDIAKTSALAIAVGDSLFWDDSNKVVNKTATAQKAVGYAVLAAADPSPTVRMRLVASTRAAGS